MKVYYAHCQAIYGTPQEDRDIELLEHLCFKVFNPNCEWVRKQLPSVPQSEQMQYFCNIVQEDCDALAFRALPDGAIPAGVLKEIQAAQEAGMPVFELPSGILRRELSVEQTREYLKEIGQR